MVKIRLEGTPHEIETVKEDIQHMYHILSESKPYQNRHSEYVRAYLDVEIKNEKGSEEDEIKTMHSDQLSDEERKNFMTRLTE